MGVSACRVQKLFIKYTQNTIVYTINAEMKNLHNNRVERELHINLRANKINKRRVFGDSPVEMPNNKAGHIAEGFYWIGLECGR